MRKGKIMGKIFGTALVFVMIGAVLPCSDYISRSQVLAQSPEEYCFGDDRAGGSHGDQNLDWVGAPHLWVVGYGPCPPVTMALIGMRRNEDFLSNQIEGGEKM